MNRFKNVYKAIDEFRDELIQKDGDKIDKIFLYGSVAKGKYKGEDSDIDIMVISKNKEIDEDILDIETNVGLKYGVLISALMTTMKELEDIKNAGYSFADNVLKGRIIYERRKKRNRSS
jgi:predicted nucleotidyltransferase